MAEKNVLLIAYGYPPFGQTSSRRSGCMAKYLSCFGWTPFVLTRKWTPTNGPYDPTIVKGIPEDVIVHKMAYDVRQHSIPARVKKRLYQTLFPHKDPIEFFRKASLILPDLIQKHRIHVIWATFPPLCDLALADNVSKAKGIPWVADFRDVSQFIDGLGEALMRPMRLFQEKRVLKSASAIITVSDGFARTLRQRHNREVMVIPNGFDPDIMTTEQSFVFPKFEIVYTGGINTGHPDFTPLLDAVQNLCHAGKMDSEDILISFYGEGNERRLKRLFRHPLSRVIRNCGGVPRSESLAHQCSALILLQTAAPGTGWMTSKIYEYLIARRPILAIPRDGDSIEKLMRETNAGASCSTKDEIADQLTVWYSEWKKTGTVAWHGDMRMIMQFSRKEQAKETTRLLDEVIAGRS